MASFGSNFNPAAVAMGRSSSGPYLWSGPGNKPPQPGLPAKPITSGPAPAPSAPAAPAQPAGPAGNILGPESIRATGTGPYDAAYRQNLATYAGGQFSRPGGMSFNPTDPSTFPGQATGGGNAPVTGMPSSLLDTALGGQGFSWTPPQPAQTAQNPGDFQGLQQWLDQFMKNGRNGRMGALT